MCKIYAFDSRSSSHAIFHLIEKKENEEVDSELQYMSVYKCHCYKLALYLSLSLFLFFSLSFMLSININAFLLIYFLVKTHVNRSMNNECTYRYQATISISILILIFSQQDPRRSSLFMHKHTKLNCIHQ